MNKKLLIVLFATIFYNGVIYASPVSEHVTEVRLPEEKPPTALPATVDHISKKPEPFTALVTEDSTSATQKPSLPLNFSETPAATVATPMPVAVSSAAAPVTQISESKNPKPSQSATAATPQVNPVSVTEGKNSLSTAEVDVSKSPVPPSEAPPVTKASVAPSTPAPRASTAAATKAPTTATPKTTANATSIAPISPSSEKVMVHNVPTPAEEKHFDGPSFIGGIVLTLGVTAIGFIAFKYYKAGKLNMNYRTL